MSDSSIALLAGEPQRQSPLAVLFLILRAVRSIGIVQIVIGAGFLLSQSPSILWVALGALAVFVVAVALGLLGWWRYTFAIDNGELQVNRGVLSRKTLTVPLDRVQSVSIEQKFLHRLVNLVQVSLDTAGTSVAEFSIDAVNRDVALALQTAAADYSRSTEASAEAAVLPGEHGAYVGGVDGSATATDGVPAPPSAPFVESVVVKHPPGRIAKIALTQMPLTGLVILGPLFAFGDNLRDLLDFLPFDVPEFDPSTLTIGAWLIWFVPLALLVVVLVSVILNVVRVLLADWDLTITRTESGLRRNAGLLSKSSVASSLPRVQSVATSQGLIQRWANIYNVSLHNIGEADFFVPGCDAEQVELLRDLALADSDGVSKIDRRVSSLEVFKNTRNASVVAGLLAAGTYSFIGLWALCFLLVIPVMYLQSRRTVRLRRWGIDADAIARHDEFLGWSREEALLRKTNGVSVRQSLFERKRGLATVNVQFAGGILGGGSISISMIPVEQANAVRDRALYVAETDRRAYM